MPSKFDFSDIGGSEVSPAAPATFAPIDPAAPVPVAPKSKFDFSDIGGKEISSYDTNVKPVSDGTPATVKEPYYNLRKREIELQGGLEAELAKIDAMPDVDAQKPLRDAAYAKFEMDKQNDPTITQLRSAHNDLVKKLAETNGYDPIQDTDQQFLPPDQEEIMRSQGIDPREYAKAKGQTAKDVYAYRTRNFGSPFSHGSSLDGLGHETKEQAKEAFGLAPAVRGAGYLTQDIGTIGSGIANNDPQSEAKAELARREVEAGALKAGTGIINMGVGSKRWYERNFPKWLGGKAGNWFGGADDFAKLSDAEIEDRFNNDLKFRKEIPEALKPQNFTPSFGDNAAYKDVVKQAGGEMKANLDNIRLGTPTGPDGIPLAKPAGAEQRMDDISTANTFAAIPSAAFNNPLTRGVAGGALRAVGETGALMARGAQKVLSNKITHAFSAVSALSGHIWTAAGSLVASAVGEKVAGGLAKGFSGLSTAGKELLENTGPQTRQGVFSTMGKEGAKSVATGAAGSLPLLTTADTPAQGLSMVLGGALLGATEVPVKGVHEAITGKMNKAGAANELRAAGEKPYGFGNDADADAAFAKMSEGDKDAVYKVRGLLRNLTNPDGSPVQVLPFTPERFAAQVAKDHPNATPEQVATLQGHRGYKSPDGNVYLNIGETPGRVGDTAHHEAGHVVDDLANVVMPELANGLQAELANSLYDANGKPIESFAKFAERYGSAFTGEPLKSSDPDFQAKLDSNLELKARAEREFVAETMRALMQKRSAGDFAVPKSIAERMKNGWDNFLSNRLGIERKGTKLEDFDFQEIPKVTNRLEDILFQVGGGSLKDAPPMSVGARTKQIDGRLLEIQQLPQNKLTPAILEEANKLSTEKTQLATRAAKFRQASAPVAAETPSPNAPAAPPAAFSEPHGDIGLSGAQIDALRDNWISPSGMEPAAQRANYKLGVGGKSAEKMAQERAAEFDGMFDRYASYLRENGLRAPKDPLTIEQQMIERELMQDPAPRPAFADSAPAPKPAGALSEVPEAAPAPKGLLSEPEAAPVRETAPAPVEPRGETNRPGPDVTAQEAQAVTAVAEAEKTAVASPEYGRMRSDKSKTDHVKKARTTALLDLLPENPAEPDVLQRRVDEDGKTTFKGKLDTSRPVHRLLAEQLGLGGADIGKIEALQNAQGAVFVDYLSAKNQEPTDTTGKQRQKEYRENAPGERGYGNGTIQKNKAIIPTSTTVTPNGSIVLRGVSVDKYVANVAKILDFVKENFKGQRAPYEDINDPTIAADLKGYVENHKNGYKGDGSGPIEGANVNPDYKPYGIEGDAFNVLNAAFHSDISTKIDSKKAETRQKATEAQEKALENDWPVDAETGDTNPLRAAMNASGKFVKTNTKGDKRTGTKEILENVWEALSPDMIEAVKSEPDGPRDIVRELGAKQDPAKILNEGLPNWENVASGFMPITKEFGLGQISPQGQVDYRGFGDRVLYSQYVHDGLGMRSNKRFRVENGKLKWTGEASVKPEDTESAINYLAKKGIKVVPANGEVSFMPESQKKGAFSELSDPEKERLKTARNVISAKPSLMFGEPKENAFQTKPDFVYAKIPLADVQDAKQHGFFRPDKKAKGGQSNVKIWTKGGEQFWNEPTHGEYYIAEIPADKVPESPGDFAKFEDATIYRGEKGSGFKPVNKADVKSEGAFLPKSTSGALATPPNATAKPLRGVFQDLSDDDLKKKRQLTPAFAQ